MVFCAFTTLVRSGVVGQTCLKSGYYILGLKLRYKGIDAKDIPQGAAPLSEPGNEIYFAAVAVEKYVEPLLQLKEPLVEFRDVLLEESVGDG